MANKHLSQNPYSLAVSKLKVLLESINTLYSSGRMVTESDLSSAYNEAIYTFLDSLDGSITKTTTEFLAGQPADPIQYNLLLNAIRKDLEILFLEISALDKLVTSSFNSISAARDNVLERSRIVSNKLGDYLLYADPTLGAGYFFGDSFNTSERIELNSSLVDTDECFLSTEEGVVLLPLDGNPDRPEVETYIINKPSNGTLGNNADPDITGKDNLASLGDNEPNTWIEYDRVTAYESDTPLVLDLTIVLRDISVINHIHINPINFGTPTPVKIKTLETSKDGKEFQSIKDEVPIADFTPEDEDNNFELSAATNKYAGEGFYSFLPRRVQYIHVVLEQSTPYAVNTVNGVRLRYAIGIRDINVLGRRFKTEGSLVSTPFTSSREIRKLSLWASENPTEESILADITHAISQDDGATWYDIQPSSRSTFQTDEVVNFNNISENAIETVSPVDTLRHKIYMTRDTESFNSDITISEEKIEKTDILPVPIGGEVDVTLTEEPIEESVKVVLPFWGSYSCPRPRYGTSVQGESLPMELDTVEFNVDVPPINTLRFQLPYKNFPNLKEHLRVFVNNEQVEFCHKDLAYLNYPTDTSYDVDPIDENSKVYFLNKNGSELQFGYTDSSGAVRGFVPPNGAKISAVLDGDNPQLELTDQGYVLKLSASSDGFKENTNIVFFRNGTLDEAKDIDIQMPRGKRTVNVPLSKAGSKITNQGTKVTAEQQLKWNEKKTVEDDLIGKKITKEDAEKVEYNVDELNYEDNLVVSAEGDEGIIPKLFIDPFSAEDPSGESISIKEYSPSGVLIEDRVWTAVPFIDGEQELRTQILPATPWVYGENLFSFDAYTGTIHISNDTSLDSNTIFSCKKVDGETIKKEDWEFYKDPISSKVDTSRIILNETNVITLDNRIPILGAATTLDLTPYNSKAHDWFNKRVVKGSVSISPSVFSAGVKAVEVPFIDGKSELTNVVTIESEEINFGTAVGGIYTFSLQNISTDQPIIGLPGFAATRDDTTVDSPTNIFQTYKTTPLTVDGDWGYVDGEVSVRWTASDPGAHTVTYRYEEDDPGVDAKGLYSIDYENGVLHLATGAAANGTVKFKTSLYSAFYNIAEVVQPSSIKEISEEEKRITFNPAFSMSFLKMNTASKARPQYMRVVYDYYKKTTESIKDLEPYFSPICKDIAFRAVTADILEEL